MINLSRFSKMSFTELVHQPNAYIHTIYKLFVDDAIEREKRQKEEEANARRQQANQKNNSQFAGDMLRQQDSANVANLRNMLSGQGVSDNDLEEIFEEIEDGG